MKSDGCGEDFGFGERDDSRMPGAGRDWSTERRKSDCGLGNLPRISFCASSPTRLASLPVRRRFWGFRVVFLLLGRFLQTNSPGTE
jgi:hypothetical protein